MLCAPFTFTSVRVVCQNTLSFSVRDMKTAPGLALAPS